MSRFYCPLCQETPVGQNQDIRKTRMIEAVFGDVLLIRLCDFLNIGEGIKDCTVKKGCIWRNNAVLRSRLQT